MTTISEEKAVVRPGPKTDRPQWLEVVKRQVQSVSYGSVQIVIHDGRVVQVETSSRQRFDKAS